MKLLAVFRKGEFENFPDEYGRVVAYLSSHYEDVLTAFSDFRHERTGSSSVNQSSIESRKSLLTDSDDIDIVLVSASHRIPSAYLYESAYAEYVFTSKPLSFMSGYQIDKLIQKALKRERRFGK